MRLALRGASVPEVPLETELGEAAGAGEAPGGIRRLAEQARAVQRASEPALRA